MIILRKSYVIFFLIFITSFAMNSTSRASCMSHALRYRKCVKSWFYKPNSNYCKDEILKDYQDGLFYSLNRDLRGIERDDTCDKIGMKDALISAIKTLKNTPRVLYRGVESMPVLNVMEPYDCLIDKGIVSTSTSEKIARGFTTSINPVVLVIQAYAAKNVNSVLSDHEKEVLILPETVLMLVAVENRVINYEKSIEREKYYHFKEMSIEACRNIYH